MKSLLLLSSGIDSPVAGYLMANKGHELVGVTCLNSLKNDQHVKVVVDIAKKIGIKKLYLVKLYEIHKYLRENIDLRLHCIFCKKSMIYVANKICDIENCKIIVTGDNLGQVASQTISNMKSIDLSTDKLVIRPLLTYDKEEVIIIARKIDTYDLSCVIKEECPWVPQNPATRSNAKKMKYEESKVKDFYDKYFEEFNDYYEIMEF